MSGLEHVSFEYIYFISSVSDKISGMLVHMEEF